jgi:hypothetical protein
MPDDGRDVGRWIQQLSARLITDQLSSLERYAELLQRVARGELNEKTVRQEYLRFARENVAGYVRNLAALTVNYQNALLDLGRAYEDRFLDRVLKQDGHADAGPGGPDKRVEILLSAPIEEEASASFVIENERLDPAEISFIVSEFTGPDGEAPFRPPLRLEPPRFRLGPREEQKVTLRLPLLADLFLPGQPYSATVAVRGYGELELALTVVGQKPATASKPAVRRRRPAKPAAGARPGPAPRNDTESARKGRGARTKKQGAERPRNAG